MCRMTRRMWSQTFPRLHHAWEHFTSLFYWLIWVRYECSQVEIVTETLRESYFHKLSLHFKVLIKYLNQSVMIVESYCCKWPSQPFLVKDVINVYCIYCLSLYIVLSRSTIVHMNLMAYFYKYFCLFLFLIWHVPSHLN